MSDPMLQPERERNIAEWLEKLKFRKRILGGIDEKDVWTRIGELNDMYREALIAERARYDALLAEHEEAKGRDEA